MIESNKIIVFPPLNKISNIKDYNLLYFKFPFFQIIVSKVTKIRVLREQKISQNSKEITQQKQIVESNYRLKPKGQIFQKVLV